MRLQIIFLISVYRLIDNLNQKRQTQKKKKRYLFIINSIIFLDKQPNKQRKKKTKGVGQI